MICFGNVPAGSVLPVFFGSYGKTNGESITLTGLAVTDIEIYKGTSMTQRASDAGYTLLDTDGIDVDGTTGIHAFSIDTGDNTDAGFYAAGSFYTVVVSAVTIDSQTVNFVAATFRIVAAESVAGSPKADVSHFGGTAGTFASGRPEVNTTHVAGTSQTAGDIIGDTNDIQSKIGTPAGASVSADIAAVKTQTAAIETDTQDIQTRLPAALVGGRMDSSVGTMAANTLTASALAADAVTEIQAGLSTLDAAGVRTAVGLAAANLDTQLLGIVAYIDTEVAAILADTNELQTDWANGGRLDLLIDAVKAKTDSLTFTAASKVDANVLAIGSDTASPTILKRALLGTVIGTVDAAATTTSIPTSSLTPAAAVADQFKGRILVFDKDTTTANLRGQATEITASSNVGVLTVTALTTAPAAGDTFTIQ